MHLFLGRKGKFLQTQGGQQSNKEYWYRHWGDLQIKLDEVPLHDMTNQQVLRFSNQGGNTPKCRTYRCVHHDVTQKCTELLEVRTTVILH